MKFVLRLSSANDCQYPLPVAGSPSWEQTATGSWKWRFELPPIPAEHIIVPSFAMRGQRYQYQFSIRQTAESQDSTELMWVPARQQSKLSTTSPFTPKIDCWHTTTATEAVLDLIVHSKTTPASDLLTVSVRPLVEENFGSHHNVCAAQPKAISQMMGPPRIARGICSPTALAMAIDAPWPQTIQACFDPNTKAYGCWPLAIHWATEQGILSAVETFTSWQDVVTVLAAGRPIVCSINYEKNQLSHAPLVQTSGHLVVLYGIENDHVLVMDPAASTHEQVARRYLAREFANAWLRHRGAAYIFSV